MVGWVEESVPQLKLHEQERLEDALAAARAGRFDDAIERAEAHLDEHPQDPAGRSFLDDVTDLHDRITTENLDADTVLAEAEVV